MDVALFDWDEFEHVTKIDPTRRRPESIDVLRHTDAIIIDGSGSATKGNSLVVFERLRTEFPDLPLVQEPYRSACVSKRTVRVADAVFVPTVYNDDKTSFVEKHIGFFTELTRKSEDVTGSGLPFVGNVLISGGHELVDGAVGGGYVVQNPDSEVAGLTNVEEHYTPEQVANAALATESSYGFPIFYIEYSRRYVGPEDMSVVALFLDGTALLYGGGIRSRARTDKILDAGADAIVAGDCLHEDTECFLETVPTT